MAGEGSLSSRGIIEVGETEFSIKQFVCRAPPSFPPELLLTLLPRFDHHSTSCLQSQLPQMQSSWGPVLYCTSWFIP